MERNRDGILDRINRKKNDVDENLRRIESNDLIERRVYSSLSESERSLGVYHLAVGEQEEAKHWFTEATKHNLISVRKYREYSREKGFSTWENEALKLRDCIYMGILGQNQNCIDETIKNVTNIPNDFPVKYPDVRPWYDFDQAVATLLRENWGELDIYIDNLRSNADVFDEEMTVRYTGLADTLEGITIKDVELITSGIADTLVYHETNSNQDSIKSSDLVCLPAAAMTVLATMYNVHPAVKNPYIPDVLGEEYVELHY